jgi:hypothetical protein
LHVLPVGTETRQTVLCDGDGGSSVMNEEDRKRSDAATHALEKKERA